VYDVDRADTARRKQHDLGPPGMLLRGIAVADDRSRRRRSTALRAMVTPGRTPQSRTAQTRLEFPRRFASGWFRRLRPAACRVTERKARGVKLGNPTRRPPRATAEARARGAAATAELARAFAERLRPLLASLDGLSARAQAASWSVAASRRARGGHCTAGSVIHVRQWLGL